jgi:hypothetical protein
VLVAGGLGAVWEEVEAVAEGLGMVWVEVEVASGTMVVQLLGVAVKEVVAEEVRRHSEEVVQEEARAVDWVKDVVVAEVGAGVSVRHLVVGVEEEVGMSVPH